MQRRKVAHGPRQPVRDLLAQHGVGGQPVGVEITCLFEACVDRRDGIGRISASNSCMARGCSSFLADTFHLLSFSRDYIAQHLHDVRSTCLMSLKSRRDPILPLRTAQEPSTPCARSSAFSGRPVAASWHLILRDDQNAVLKSFSPSTGCLTLTQQARAAVVTDGAPSTSALMRGPDPFRSAPISRQVRADDGLVPGGEYRQANRGKVDNTACAAAQKSAETDRSQSVTG